MNSCILPEQLIPPPSHPTRGKQDVRPCTVIPPHPPATRPLCVSSVRIPPGQQGRGPGSAVLELCGLHLPNASVVRVQGGKKNKIKNNNNKKAHRLCRQTWCTSDKMPHAFSAGRKPLHLSPSGVCRDSGCCSRALQQQQEQL